MNSIMLRNVPAHWKVERLGQLFAERREKVSDEDFAPLSVTKNGILPQMEHVAKTNDGENRKLVRAGDFVINSRSDRRGSSGLSEYDGSVSLISIVLEPRHGYPRFLHYLLKSYAFQEEFYRFGHGIVADLWTTRFSDMKGIQVGIPDFPTQKTITDFLDRETARIDQLIEKKQQMIERLRERKQSLIDHSIATDGPSTKLGHHVRILPGFAFPSAEFSTNPEDIRLLRGANVAPGSIRWDDVVYWPRESALSVMRFHLRAGDIVLGMDRPWISSGIRVAQLTQADVPALLLQRVCKIEPQKTLDKNYLLLLLQSKRFLAYFEPILTGVSVPHISGDQIAEFSFAYIDRNRQRAKAETCLQQIAHGERLISRIAESIDRLREFRSSLITAAVTGQIDVATWGRRGESNQLLETIEETLEAEREEAAV